MALKQWVQQNPFVAASAALPIVIVALFVASSQLPRLYVDDPQYDFVFSVKRHWDPTPYNVDLEAKDGKIVATVNYLENQSGYRNDIYRYRAQSGTIEKLDYAIPDGVQKRIRTTDGGVPSESFVVPFPETISGPTSPDGYTFSSDWNAGAGLISDLFGAGRRHLRLTITKSGRVIKVETEALARYPYFNDVRFLGWVAK